MWQQNARNWDPANLSHFTVSGEQNRCLGREKIESDKSMFLVISVLHVFTSVLSFENRFAHTTISSIGTGMNIFGLSFGFWLMKRDTLYNMAIQIIEITTVI